MKVRSIHRYSGPIGDDGLVAAYDVTVAELNNYKLGAGPVVSNSKRISMLDVNALLSSGAIETLRDVGAVRGQQNDEAQFRFMSGHTPLNPKVPFVYDKFHHQLRAAGINVIRDGGKVHIMALTNKDVHALTEGRLLKNGETVNFGEELQPIPGGLFDPQITGGHGSTRWSGIALDEPMPSPVMEEPIRRILRLTQKQYEGVISGTHDLPGYGSGPAAIHKALDGIDLPSAINEARNEAENGRKSTRDDAYRRLSYLKSASRLKLHPRDWMLDRVPVLPPVFRPVSLLGDSGIPLVSDPNVLYKEAIEANSNLRDMKKVLGDQHVGAERLALYHAFKAVTGLGDPITVKSREKNINGILRAVFGHNPKQSVTQRKLLSSTVDNVARAVIAPNPDFDLDTVGLPEDRAFDIYGKFLVRRMARRGMPVREALRHVKDRTDLARDSLLQEISDRPVYINRAPVLHKFGILAFRPRLVSGDVVQMPPLVYKGYGADNDGDAVQVHVPSSEEARKEALERLLPSKNLFSPSDFKTVVHAPAQEYIAGLYELTRKPHDDSRRPLTFRTRQDAINAYNRGDIGANDQVVVLS